MKPRKATSEKLAALKQVNDLASRLGADTFSWAARKYLAIRAAERAAARIRREADRKIEKLRRVAG